MTETLTRLRQKNSELDIWAVTDARFARYGRVLEELVARQALAFAEENAIPGESVIYEPSVAELEADEALVEGLRQRVYGGMPIQVGWCYGRSRVFDRLEYHKGSETLVSLDDVVLFLGHVGDMSWRDRISYHAGDIQAFFVPQGTTVELYPWCLHLAPCHVRERTGFRTLVVLPRGSNFPLDFEPTGDVESALLAGRNKWRLLHPHAEERVPRGAYMGIEGNILTLQTL
jgi:hypothetical protein